MDVQGLCLKISGIILLNMIVELSRPLFSGQIFNVLTSMI